MTNERDDSMETTGTKTDPESSAVQVDDDANTDSGNSPPLAGDPSSHHALKPRNIEVAATKMRTAADLSHETPPTDAPETSDDEDPLRDLPPEDQETARRLIAWGRDMDAAKDSGETKRDIARLYPRDVVLGKVKYDPTKDGAGQRLMREKYAQDDLRTSGFTEAEVQALRVSDFEFAYVDAKAKIACKEIRAFIEKYESLQRMPNRPTHRFVARAKKNGKLAGVVVMATGYNESTYLMGEKDELIEVRRHDAWLKEHRGEPAVVKVPAVRLERLIARGACISWSPKGLGSALVMWSIQWMVRNTECRVFTAYSDPEAGELGTIYRGLEFQYVGGTQRSKACFDPSNPQRGEFSDKDLRRLSRYKRYAKQLGIPWDGRWHKKTSVVWDQMPPDIKKALKQAAKDAESRCRVRWQAPKLKWAYVLGVNSSDTRKLRERFEALNAERLKLTPPKERGVPPEIERPSQRGERKGKAPAANGGTGSSAKAPKKLMTTDEICRAITGKALEEAAAEVREAQQDRSREDGSPTEPASRPRLVSASNGGENGGGDGENPKFCWRTERCDRRVRRREKRKFYDFWRTVRYVAQRQQETQGEPFNPDETAAADEPVAEQPVDASNKLPAAMEPLAGAGNGNGPHVSQPAVKPDTPKGTPRIDAPPHGGINGARRPTIGAPPREGINENRLEPKSVRLSSVQPEEVRWLWTGRVPLGKIMLLDGDPDVGKTFITHDLAARVTTGAEMPFDTTPAEPAGVVILSAEDGLADTIRPRIEAAGGDPEQIECFALGTLPFIPDDLTAIEEAVTRVQARLIVVDPLIAFLKVSATNDQRVRQAMTPLADLAQRLGVAVIGIRHLTKNDRQKLAKYRGSGSIGLLGAARAAFLAAPHPTDPTRYVLARSKRNLCAPPPAVTYKIDRSLRVEWLEEVEITADELLTHPTPAPAPRLAEAMDFLRDALKDGPRDATDVTSEAFAKGITAKTLRDAREALGVVVKRAGFGAGSKFVWSLPPAESTSNDAEG